MAPEVAGATILLNGLLVPNPSSAHHLGVVLSSSLSWCAHIASLGRQVGWKVSLLKRLAFRANMPLYVLSLLYKTLVRPCMEYTSSVWDNCSAADSDTLERLQLSLSSVFLSVHFGSSYVSQLSKSQRLHLLCWPTSPWRRRRQKLILFWQLKNGFGPSSLSAQLPAAVSARCHYALRSSHSYQVPFCSSSSHLSSFLPSTCVIWNSLPVATSSARSVPSFTSLLHQFFASDTYYFSLPT